MVAVVTDATGFLVASLASLAPLLVAWLEYGGTPGLENEVVIVRFREQMGRVVTATAKTTAATSATT